MPLDAVLRVTDVVSVWLAHDMMHPLAKAIAALTQDATNQAENKDVAIIEKDEGHVHTQTMKHFQLFMESPDGSNNGVILLQCKNSVQDTTPFLCAHVEPLQHSNFDNTEQKREIVLLKEQKDDVGNVEAQFQLNFQVGITTAHPSVESEGDVDTPPLPPVHDKQVAMPEEKEEEAKKSRDTTSLQKVSLS